MQLSQLLSIGLFTALTVLTVYGIVDRMRGTNKALKEGFDLQVNQSDVDRLTSISEPVPTDLDAVKAHQTLLRYIRNDFSKGIKFVMDFGKRFFGDNMALRQNLDVRTLMDNYSNPLQVA